MAVVLRYVDKRGKVIERFVGIQHVSDTSSSSLKEAIEQLFSSTELSMSKLRGQSYDEASNMKREFNGLKAKILREHSSAFYVHCFAHQLQLALVATAMGHADIATFFSMANSVVNIVGASCKRRDALREQVEKDLMKAFDNDCLETKRGLNQESTLKRAGDTRWNSHYGTLVSIISLFKYVVKVLEDLVDEGSLDHLGDANRSLQELRSFQFVFHLFLMRFILGASNDLSQALQKKDQDIVNAMTLVKACKQQLHHMRNNGFDLLFDQVFSFCDEYNIDIPNMDDQFVALGKSKRQALNVTNLHNYRVDAFIQVIDKQRLELDNCFDEVNTELLLCLVCLSPDDSFSSFNKEKILRFAQFYPQEFNSRELLELEDQLGIYIHDMHSSEEFSNLKGISSLAQEMVKMGRNRVYNHVYLLNLGFSLAGCNRFGGESIFRYEYLEKSTSEQNGRSMVE